MRMDKKNRDKKIEEPNKASQTEPSPERADEKAAASMSKESDKKSGQKPDQASMASADKPSAAQEKTREKTRGKAGEKASSKPGKPGEQTADKAGDENAGPTTADKQAPTSPGKSAGQLPQAASAADAKPRSVPWLIAAIILMFALVAGGGWQLWQLNQAQEQLRTTSLVDQKKLADRLDGLSAEMTDTQSALDALGQQGEAIRQDVESALTKQFDELTERQDSLGQRVASIDDRLARGEIAWKTAEVGFLITRAQERLVIARDPDGAALALKLADERVAALSRSYWLPLRSAISDALVAIEATGEEDRVGQALSLRRLIDQIGSWPLAGRGAASSTESEVPAVSAPEDSAPSVDVPWYQQAWATASGWLSSQVSVTRSDKPVRLHERVAIDREMRLWLTAVRESLLSRDHKALAATIAAAREWLDTHYATEVSGETPGSTGGPAAAQAALDRVAERFASRDFPSLEAVIKAWERASAHEQARTAAEGDADGETSEETQ